MIHKIQTAGSYYVSLEVKNVKGEPCLCISKDASLLTLDYAETKQLNIIVQSVDAQNYTIKEYGIVKKGSEIYLSNANSATSGLDARMIHSTGESVIANKVKQSQFSKADVYKVFISEFRGIKSFQIRQRTVSPTYSGFSKLGITLPTHKIKELQIHLKTVMQEFIDK